MCWLQALRFPGTLISWGDPEFPSCSHLLLFPSGLSTPIKGFSLKNEIQVSLAATPQHPSLGVQENSEPLHPPPDPRSQTQEMGQAKEGQTHPRTKGKDGGQDGEEGEQGRTWCGTSGQL